MASEEKRGLFGRLFGGKKKPKEEEVQPTETLEESVVEAPASEPAPSDDLLEETDEISVSAGVPDAEDRAEERPADIADVDQIATDELLEDAEQLQEPQLSSQIEDAGPTEEPLPEVAPDVSTSAQQQDEDQAPAAATAAEPIEALEPQPEPELAQEPEPKKKKGFFGRLAAGLARTSSKLTGGIGAIFTKKKLDDETLEELEDLLITADLGLPTTTRIITALSKDRYDKEVTDEEVREVLADEITKTLEPLEKPLVAGAIDGLHIILVTGVNGAGKTTTIGKLAKQYTDSGKKVVLAAGDTFRAAAIEQLKVWGDRTGSAVIAKDQGADAAGLAFDAVAHALETGADILMIDTAGRLQNRRELMDELSKIVRVIKKQVPDAPHDTLLVLDATVGQNALSQAQTFTEVAGVTGLVMTKLDGTARGGVLVALGDKFELPIHYIGVGEGVEDLQPFVARDFARSLTGL